MKKNYSILVMLSLIVIVFTVIISCNKIKDATEAVNSDPQSAKDYVTASSTFTDVFKKVSDAIRSQNLLKSNKHIQADSCPTIITSPGAYPKTIKIVFDTVNGCSSEKVTYKGTIIVQMTGPLTATGSASGITFKNFSVNGNAVTGVGSITTTGTNS